MIMSVSLCLVIIIHVHKHTNLTKKWFFHMYVHINYIQNINFDEWRWIHEKQKLLDMNKKQDQKIRVIY